jgi:hypothetical protein
MPRSSEPSSRVSARAQLEELEEHVRRRMEELAPLVEEYRELEQIARRLGLLDAGGDWVPPEQTRDGGRVPDRPRPTIHAPAGHRHRQLLSLVRERPGVTVREAAAEIGVDPTSLYRIVRRLVSDGDIEKRSRSLHPV